MRRPSTSRSFTTAQPRINTPRSSSVILASRMDCPGSRPKVSPRVRSGPLAASASSEGYSTKPDVHRAFHGYFFRMLKGQTDKAPGGAKDYFVDGKMVGGFAFVAYPAEYGNSGVMTFIINQDGVLLQRDLGKTTAEIATAMTEFDPNAGCRLETSGRGERAIEPGHAMITVRGRSFGQFRYRHVDGFVRSWWP